MTFSLPANDSALPANDSALSANDSALPALDLGGVHRFTQLTPGG